MVKAIPRAEFFRARVRVEPSGCWSWTGVVYPSGYGGMRVDRKLVRVHRYAYELYVGPIPVGLQLDHLCHTNDATCSGGNSCPHRRCVNPDHLEPVAAKVNVERGVRGRISACPAGHPYDEANTYRDSTGRRHCRACRRATAAARSESAPRLLKGNANTRKTHCPQGHPYSGENLAINSQGRRTCKACNRDRAQRSAQAKKRQSEDRLLDALMIYVM